MDRKIKAVKRPSINGVYQSRKKQSGLAIVEMSVVASFFFLLFFIIVDLSVFGYVKLTMQNAVREGTRYAITGRSDLDPDGNGVREAAILAKVNEASHGYLERLMEIDDVRVEDLDGNPVTGFGQGGDIIAIHLDCEWTSISPFTHLFLDDGKYTFTVSSAMRNEAFE
ncbi:TadE/TadG family type IV pilus assembly protein [Vibrio sp. WXL103]